MILAAIVAGPVIAIVSFVGAADDAIDEVTGVLDGTTTIDEPGVSEPEAERAAPGRHRRPLDGAADATSAGRWAA